MRKCLPYAVVIEWHLHDDVGQRVMKVNKSD